MNHAAKMIVDEKITDDIWYFPSSAYRVYQACYYNQAGTCLYRDRPQAC